MLALALPVLLMARDEFDGGEFPALLLSSLYGVWLLHLADSFLTLFLGLEIMSLPVYVLVLLAYQRPESAEAALKYLVLGGTATAMFLMGVSLLYGASGTMELRFSRHGARLGRSRWRAPRVVLVLAGLLPEGRDRAVPRLGARRLRGRQRAGDGLHGDIVKAGVLLAAVRLFGDASLSAPLLQLLVALPLVSIVWGNLAAMRQPNLRRMIAY